MAEPSYLEIIRQYPIPTGEQTREFAAYVASAHSWYKHLPVYPPMPFRFYLDPNAGRSTIISEDGEIKFEDIVDESTRFHYTWQLTETYRERLGYWNYLAPYGTHFLIPRGQDVIDTKQSGHTRSGPAIFMPEVGWIMLPDALVQAGTAGVTALIHEVRDLRTIPGAGNGWRAGQGGRSERVHRAPSGCTGSGFARSIRKMGNLQPRTGNPTVRPIGRNLASWKIRYSLRWIANGNGRLPAWKLPCTGFLTLWQGERRLVKRDKRALRQGSWAFTTINAV